MSFSGRSRTRRPSEEAIEAGGSHNLRILVADASQADRQIYKKMLNQYQADIVSSGTGALDMFDTNNYDVILLDCNLEGKHLFISLH